VVVEWLLAGRMKTVTSEISICTFTMGKRGFAKVHLNKSQNYRNYQHIHKTVEKMKHYVKPTKTGLMLVNILVWPTLNGTASGAYHMLHSPWALTSQKTPAHRKGRRSQYQQRITTRDNVNPFIKTAKHTALTKCIELSNANKLREGVPSHLAL